MALGSNIQYKASVLFQAAYDKESAKDYENRLVDLSKNAAEMSKKEFAKAFKGLGNIINEALRTLKMPEIDVSNILKTNTNIEAFSKLGEEFGESFNEGIEIALTNNGNINKLLEIKIRKLESNKLYKAQRRISAVKHLSKAEGVYDLGSGSVRFTDFSNKTTEDVAKEMDSLYEGIDNLLSGLKSINQKTNPDKYHEQLRSLQDRIADYIEGIGGLQKIPSLSGNSKYTVEALRQLTGKHGFGMEFWSDHVARAQKDMGKYRGTDEYIQMTKLEDSIRTLEAQAQYASKSVRDITQAIGEMSSLSRPEQKKKVKGVEQVIADVESGKAGQVGRAFNQYKDAKDAGSDWVTMYSKALKFLTAFNAMDPEKQLTAERDWRILAERLNPMFDQIKSSLELFVQTANARLYPPSGGGDGTGGGTGGGSGSGTGTGGSGYGGVGAGTQPEQSNNAPKIEEENNVLKEKLNLLKQIAAAYEYQADAELDDNDQEWDNARESVEEFENAYYSAIVTMQDGSKVELLLDDEFAETAQNILADAKNIQNIDLVPKSAEAAIQAYNHVEQVQANIRSSLSRSWSQPINGKTEDALLYLGRTRTMLETAISNMNQGDPDGSWDFSGAQQTATQLLSTIEDMQQKFAMMLQTEHKLKEMNITPDAEHYYDVVEGIKNNTLTTVDQCIAKYKELAGVVDTVGDKTDTTPETGRGTGDGSGSGGSGSGDGGGGGPNDGELQNLEAIEAVVGRIKTAVGEKSKAFLEEQIVVKRIAQSEVHSLGEVEKKVNAVRVALERICGGKISSGMMTININTSGNGSGKNPGTAKSLFDDYEKLGRLEAQRDDLPESRRGPIEQEIAQLEELIETKQATLEIDKDLYDEKRLDAYGKKKAEIDNAKAANRSAVAFKKRLELEDEYFVELEKLGKLEAQQALAQDDVKHAYIPLIEAQKKIVEGKEKELGIDSKLYELKKEQVIEAEKLRLQLNESKSESRRQRANSKTNAQLSRTRSTVFTGQDILKNLENVDVVESAASKITALRNAVEELKKTYNELNNQADPISETQAKDVIDQTNNVRKLNAEMKRLFAQHQKLSGDNVEVIGQNQLKNGATVADQRRQIIDAVVASQKKGQVSISGFNNETGELIGKIKEGNHEFTSFSARINELNGNIVLVKGQTKQIPSLLETIIEKTRQLGIYLTGSFLINFARQQLQKGIQYVKEIDSALTELKKVTDETEESYERFVETASKTADKIGSTIAEVVSSTADFARLGYSLQEAAQMAESAQVLMNVSEFTDISAATDSLISAIQAFNYTADESMHVVDIMNTIGNKYAISTADLASSLTRSSAALVAAGNTMEESVALTAAANTIIQDADSVGNALKTVSMRIRGTTVKELEAAGEETDGLVESTSKLYSKIKSLTAVGGKEGISILGDDGKYLNTYEILVKIAERWEDITEAGNDAALLEILAGKTRGSVVAALLQQPDTLKDAYEDALNAEGSALKENEKYLDSIQGKVDKFTNALQAMWQDELGSGLIKGFVDLGTILVKLIDNVGLLGTLLTTLSTIYMVKNKMGPLSFIQELIGAIPKGINKIQQWAQNLRDVGAATSKLSEVTQVLTQTKLKDKLMSQGLTDATAEEIIAKTGLGKTTDSLSAKVLDETLKKMGYSEAQRKAIIQTVFDTEATEDNTDAKRENTAANAAKGESDSQSAAKTTANAAATKVDTEATEDNTDANLKNAASNTVAAKAESADTNATTANIAATAKDNATTNKNSAANVANAGTNLLKAGGSVGGSASKALVPVGTRALTTVGGSTTALTTSGGSAVGGAGLAGAASAAMTVVAVVAALVATIAIIDKFTVSIKEAAEATKEAMAEFDEASQALRSKHRTIQSIRGEYEELAKGVDNLGNNVSLTTEEYERYNEIANEIAAQFPQMIAGFTDEGTAILKQKGNVEALTDAYEKEAAAARQALLANSKEIVKNSYVQAGNAWMSSDGFWGESLKGLGEMFSGGLYTDSADNKELSDLKAYLDGDLEAIERFADDSMKGYNLRKHILQSLQDLGADVSFWDVKVAQQDKIDEIIAENRDLVEVLVGQYDTVVNEAASNSRSLIEAYLDNSLDYNELDSDTQGTIKQVVQNLSDEFVTSFKNNEELYAWVESSLLSGLGGVDENTKLSITSAFDLQTKFNNGTVSIEDYETQVQKIIETIDLLDLDKEDDIIKSIKLIFDIDDNGEIDVAKQNVAKELLDDQFDANVKELTLDQLNVIDEYYDQWSLDGRVTLTWDELLEKLKQVQAMAEDESLANSITKFSDLEDAYGSLGDAIQEFKENGYVASKTLEDLSESFGDVDGFDELYKALVTGEGDVESAVTNVANAYINRQGILSDLTDDELKMMASRLEGLGVLNAQEVLQKKQVAQEKLNTELQGYNIDLGAYATAEAAKIAIAQQSGLDMSKITDDNISQWEEYYGIDLSNYATVAEKKIAIAREMAKETAAANRAAALTDLDKEYSEKGYYGSEKYRVADYRNKRQEIFDAYNSAISSIPTDSALANIQSIVDDYYNQSFDFNFNNRIGIGPNYKDDITDKSDKESQKALDNLTKKYERKVKNLENQQEYLQNKIDTLEAQKEYDPQNAKGISTDYYEEQIRLENEKLKLYRAEYAELSKLEKTDEVAERMWELEHAIQESAQRTLEFRQSIAELYNTAFEDIQTAGDNKDDYLQDQKDYIEAYIEAQGRDTTKADLEQLRTITEQQRKDREETLEDLKATLKQGVDSGAIKEGSEIWIQMNDEIRATELAIQDDTKAINEYSEAIKNIPVEVFNRMREAFGFKDQVYNNQIDYIEGWMELAEKQGYDVPNEALDKILAIYGNAKENNLADIYNAMEDLPKIEAEFGVNSEEYQNAYLKLSDLIKQGLDIDNAIADTQQRQKEQPINEFEDTKDWFAFEDSLIEKRKESIENYISKLEESGDYDGLETKYGELIQAEQDDIDMNMQELTATEAAIKAAIDAGYTMEDEELQNLILHYGDVESEIAASRDRQTELNREIDSIPVKKLEELKNGYAFINDVLGSYRDVTKGWIDLFKNAGSAIPDELYNELFEINELMQGHNANNLADSLAAFEDIKAKYAPNTKEYQDAVNHIASLYMEEVNLATEAQSYNQEMAEANEEAGNIPVENFERMRDAFAFIADVLASTQGYIESYISLFEELGVDVPTELYDKLIDLEKQKKSNAESDLASALTGFEEIKAAGYTAADEEYRSAEQAILDLKQSILDSDIAMVKWGKTIRDLEFEKFERGVSRANDAIDEVQKIYDLTSKDDVADEDGSWTEDGITSLGLMYEQMELAQQIATKYADEIKKLDAAYANGEMSEKEYYERLQQLKDGQWGAIDSYEAAREAIVDMEEARIDMVEEGINKEIDAYRELIETKKEELDAERDLHGFRNKIKDQTKDITSLTRKIAALSGSDNAADIAERRKLQAQLAEAQEQLDETYYDHSKDQQGKALDDELESFQDIKENYVETLRESLDDTTAIISAKINELLVNADTVQQGVNNTAAEYGITLTDLLTNPWNSGSNSADDFAAQVGLDLASLLGESGAITLFENQATTAMQGAFGAARQSSTDFSGGVSIDVNSLMAEPDGPLYKLKQFLTDNVPNAFDAAGDASDDTKNDIGEDADESETSVTDFEKLLNQVLDRIAEKLGTDKETVLSDLKYPWENAGSVLDMLFGDKITGENGLLKKILTETQTWADNMKNGLGSAFDIPKSTLDTFSKEVGKVLDALQIKADNLAKALSDAANTETPNHTGNGSGGGGGSNDYQAKIDSSPANTKNIYNPALEDLQYVLNQVFKSGIPEDGLWGSKTENALKAVERSLGISADGLYDNDTRKAIKAEIERRKKLTVKEDGANPSIYTNALARLPLSNNQFHSYAKGTLGTKKDGWAFTDESWIGEEITLAAGKNGQIQYLKKGSSVMPSDISTNLIEWGKLNPEMMNLNGGVNFNMINNATNKPEFNLSFEALVKADKITEDTLPEVKKYVSQEINNLVKQMNYAIKGYSR